MDDGRLSPTAIMKPRRRQPLPPWLWPFGAVLAVLLLASAGVLTERAARTLAPDSHPNGFPPLVQGMLVREVSENLWGTVPPHNQMRSVLGRADPSGCLGNG